MHGAETGSVASVYDLLGRCRIEPGSRFDGEDQHGLVAERELQRPCRVTDGNDGVVGARRQAETDTRARLVHNPDFLILDRYGIRGAHAYTCQARDAPLRVDFEMHAHSGWALESFESGVGLGPNLSRIP